MIKYNLICKNCEKSFDSWFLSSKEFDKLKKLRHICCHYCNSLRVQKSLMAPSILSIKDKKKSNEEEKYLKVKKKIKKYQKFIKNNFKYVGENFAYEARSIHYNNKKNKNIYGKATLDEISDLKEEGIVDIETIPWIKDSEN